MNIHLMSLLMAHFLCNAQAAQQAVSIEDARFCSLNFETLKIFIHPEVSWSEFTQYPNRQKAEISLEGYMHYRRWISDNPDIEAYLKNVVDGIVPASSENEPLR